MPGSATGSIRRRLSVGAAGTAAVLLPAVILFAAAGCGGTARERAGEGGAIHLVQLNPGHFHAGLVQQKMYAGIDPRVFVYAPAGPELEDFLSRIEAFNTRAEEPTAWRMTVYRGSDYLERMLAEQGGQDRRVLITAGNNARKTEYIHRAVAAGLHVLADKPMVITPDEYPRLVEAFRIAGEKGVLLYDIMTERFEITNLLQRELSMIPALFGTLEPGTPEDPSVTKESVHHLFKYVSGTPLTRPGWFFDVTQEGTGLADVGTHLVDLIQWACFPGEIIDPDADIEMLSARGWTTDLTLEQYTRVTGLAAFPGFLAAYIEQGRLRYPCNGTMTYRIRGVCARVSVSWNYEAPAGTGDTHYSLMRGTGCELIIRQGAEEAYQPTLYLEARGDAEAFAGRLARAFREIIAPTYPGVEAVRLAAGSWRVEIPAEYKVGHEAHFAQVIEAYLRYLEEGALPDWEVPDMIAKYHTTTAAVGMVGGR